MSKFHLLLKENSMIREKLEKDGVKEEYELPDYNDDVGWQDLKRSCGISGGEFRTIRKTLELPITTFLQYPGTTTPLKSVFSTLASSTMLTRENEILERFKEHLNACGAHSIQLFFDELQIGTTDDVVSTTSHNLVRSAGRITII
eukprot:scaffold601_cov170-Ochromonas_danica.AAC.1